MTGIHIAQGYAPHHQADAARLFWAAFSQKLSRLMGPDDKALAFFTATLAPAHVISALDTQTGQLLGIAGFKTADGAFSGGSFGALAKAYGVIGAGWRALPLSLLERDLEPDTLLMDGICVDESARGKGVGTQLLQAITAHARATGHQRVRLEVIDTNPRARALYDRCGFQAQSVEKLGLLAPLFGFSTATKMVLALE